jgi:ubiquinone/menaquinone biosynthesis C-methylase UbiE
VREYYNMRAPEYDEWYRGTGLFADRDREGWAAELQELTSKLAALPPSRTLDVACGTGFLTRWLPGAITGLDQSAEMLELAREQAPAASFVRGDGLDLPFADGEFERVFTGHFYGHLDPDEGERFLSEASRVATELVVVDTHLQAEQPPEHMQERVLNDGSRFTILKRYFSGGGLADEIGGGEVLHNGAWFVMVRRTA